jgi:archaetidylinositol phosphate synthase
MLTKLKQKVQQMLTVEAKAAHRIHLTPNRISGVGMMLAFLSAFAYSQWKMCVLWVLVAAVLLLLSGFCDALDGVVARLYGQATAFGGFLDSLLDRYADAAVYVAIVISGLCEPLWGTIALAGSLLVSYSRARAEAAGVKMESIGIAERAERIIILVVASILSIYWSPTMIMNAAIILLAVLSNLTVLQRSIHAYNRFKKKETD